jgi:WD40 repeat protein
MQNTTPSATGLQTCPRCGFASDARGATGLCPRCLWTSSLFSDDPDPWLGSAREPGDADGPPFRAPSKVLAGCELIEEIARGGMGVVYRARQTALNRTVAVKVLAGGPFASPEFLGRFRAEAGTAARLKHPNIVAIHEIGEEDGVAFFTMDFVDGPNLAQRAREEPFLPREAAACVETVARAVAYAHSQGVLHRDLKPSNILLDLFGQPQITDFGLAKQLESDSPLATRHSSLTLSGQSLGSPGYAAPEQIRAGQADARSDVYGLGATLYHLLTGRPPFAGATAVETLRAAQDDDPVSPRALNATVPPDLETICLKCLEKEPSKRYATAQDLADDLERFLNDEPILARPVTRVERLGRWCRRKPALATSIFLILILLVIVIIASPIAAYRIDQARQTAEQESRNARRNLYFAQIRLAERALADGNPGHAARLLEQHIPPSDGAEDFRDWEWRYLWNQVRSDAAFELGTHDSLIRSVAISPSGRLAASSDFAGGVSLWNLETSRRLASFKEPDMVHEVLFFSDSVLLTAGGDGAIGFHDVEQGKRVRTIELGMPVRAIALSRDCAQMAALCGKEGVPAVTRIWQLSAATPTEPVAVLDLLHTVPSPKGGQWPYTGGALSFSPSGEELAVGDVANLVRIYASASAQLRRTLGTETTQGGITTVDFSPDGRWLASQGTGGQTSEEAVVWNAMTGELVSVLPGHGRGVRDVRFTTDGTSLLVTSGDQVLRQWRTSDWSLRRAFMGHRNPANALCVSPVGSFVLSGGSDGRLLAWDLSQPGKRVEPQILKSCRGLQFSPSGDLLATVEPAVDRPTVFRVGLRSARDLRSRVELPALGDDVADVAFSPDGRLLAALSRDSIRLWNVLSNELVWTERLPISNSPLIVGFTQKGERLLLIDQEFAISAVDAVSGQIQTTWSARGTHPMASRFGQRSIAFHRQSQSLVLGYVGVASVWDVVGQRCRGELSGHSIWRVEPAISWDGSVIATLGEDGDRQVRLWNASTLALVGSLDTPPHPIHTAAFSPNGRRIAVGLFRFGAAGIYDVATGMQLISLPPLEGNHARSIQWSPDGSTLVTQADDAAIWQLPSVAYKARQP